MSEKPSQFSNACEEMRRQDFSRVSLALGLSELISSKILQRAVKQIVNSGEIVVIGLGANVLQLTGDVLGFVQTQYKSEEECKRDAILLVSILAFTIWSGIEEGDDDDREEWNESTNE